MYAMQIDETLIGSAIKSRYRTKKHYAIAWCVSRSKYRYGSYENMCTEELEQPQNIIVLWSTVKGLHNHDL